MIEKIKGWYDGIVNYLRLIRAEMKRVTWPTPTELKSSTVIVVITLVVITMYLWVVDKILAQVFKNFVNVTLG